MKKIFFLIMFLFSSSFSFSQESIYDIEIRDINGEPIVLQDFKGKYILFVNVASECGFTSQYAGLEQLYQEFKDNLIIIGSPCNQFNGQEPGSAQDIQQFCVKNFGVSFLLTEKIKVKGSEKHALYNWLTNKKLNGRFNSSVRWNFQKYLVAPDGHLVDYFYSFTKPMNPKIRSLLEQ